ncbi:MAG: hypothetical protein ACOCTQ_05045 [Planctomycetota bacterium]
MSEVHFVCRLPSTYFEEIFTRPVGELPLLEGLPDTKGISFSVEL